MTFEELKSTIGDCIQNPDTFPDHIDEILEAVKLAYDTTEVLTQQVNDLKDKNNDLRDVNTKLLMRQSFNMPEEKEPIQKTNDEILAELVAKITN